MPSFLRRNHFPVKNHFDIQFVVLHMTRKKINRLFHFSWVNFSWFCFYWRKIWILSFWTKMNAFRTLCALSTLKVKEIENGHFIQWFSFLHNETVRPPGEIGASLNELTLSLKSTKRKIPNFHKYYCNMCFPIYFSDLLFVFDVQPVSQNIFRHLPTFFWWN